MRALHFWPAGVAEIARVAFARAPAIVAVTTHAAFVAAPRAAIERIQKGCREAVDAFSAPIALHGAAFTRWYTSISQLPRFTLFVAVSCKRAVVPPVTVHARLGGAPPPD